MKEPPQDLLRCALVTPTYAPDLGRCELLVESVRRCAPGIPHYLIVDATDRRAFSHLEGGSTRLITSEHLLPRGFRRLPGRRSLWMGPMVRPTRGWIVQQVLKLSVAQHIPEEVLIFCDSDMCFVKPFDPQSVITEDGLVHLLDVDFSSDEVRDWTRIASELLGERDVEDRGHVGNMICWRREIVTSLIAELERRSRRDWRVQLLNLRTFSEYMLYGVYVRAVIGYAGSGHVPSTVPFVKASWGADLSDASTLATFFDDLDDRSVAVMVHSKDGVPVDSYRARVSRNWPST